MRSSKRTSEPEEREPKEHAVGYALHLYNVLRDCGWSVEEAHAGVKRWLDGSGKMTPHVNSKRVRCVDTGQEFNSIRIAAATVGVRYSALRKSINLKQRCRGLQFERVD